MESEVKPSGLTRGSRVNKGGMARFVGGASCQRKHSLLLSSVRLPKSSRPSRVKHNWVLYASVSKAPGSFAFKSHTPQRLLADAANQRPSGENAALRNCEPRS